MAIKFLSGLNLSNVTAGSILKLDSNGNIVAAVDGTDYNTASSTWTGANGGIYYSNNVRIGTYQTSVAPSAKLHVFDYQTTTPKLLIEDGNTGDASMQFKVSTQSYTMGIDNSNSDKFILAASTALGTTNVLEISTLGASAFQKDVLFNEDVFVTGGLAVGTTSPDSVVHITGTTDGTGAGADAILHVSQQGGWNANQPWALYVEGYTYLNGFRINAGDGIRALHKVSAGGQLGFSVTDTAPITFTQSNETERMRVHTNGNIGIGTTSPAHKVDIYSNENVPLRIHRPSNANLDSSGAWGIGFSTRGDANTSTTDTRAGIFSYYNGNLFLAAANTSIVADPDAYARLTILNTGNVGIGTTSPAQKLHINDGGIRVEKFATGLGGFISVGNGTEVAGNYSAYFFGNTNQDAAYFKGGIAYETLSSTNGRGDMHFLQNSSANGTNASISDSVMTILNGGNVGIGTTSPSQKLHVVGDIYTTSDFRGNSIISASAALTISNTGIQPDQGEVEDIVAFNFSTTKVSHIDTDGYIHAAGFKTNTAATGFLKANGTVDTGDFFSGAYADLSGLPTLGTMAAASTGDYKTSDQTETYVGLELAAYTTTVSFGTNAFTSFSDHSTQGYLTSYTETDTLDSVTGRGATTTNNISVGNLSAVGGTFTDPVTIYDGTTTENPRLSVGRNSGESIQFDVTDVVNTITAKQDADSNGDHFFVLDRVFAGSGDSIFRIHNDGTPDLTIDGDGVVTLNQYGTAGILQINTSGTISVDTNTYSTATGVEDNADVTDATNVAAAGALMKAGGTVTGMTIFEDGMRIGTGNHNTDGRASITFGEGATTSDSMYIEYDGENLSGDNNAIIFGSEKEGVGDIFRVTYGGSVLVGSNAVATESYVGTAISNLVDSSPATLNTLNELAAALGDDASFSTTMSTALGNRLRIDVNNQSLSSTELANARTNLGLGTAATAASTDFVAVSGDTMTGTLRLPWKWNSTDITANSFYVQRSDTEDGFAFGIGTGVSTWFSWDGSVGTKRAIDVWNDGSKILLGDGGHATEISNDLYVPNRIFHTDDTNTYMQFHAGDQWRVVTGGTERLEVNNSATTVANLLTASGGINGLTLANGGISGTNYNITGVNQLEIADPGEGIVFKAGSSGDMTLAIVDDTADNILRFSGTNATFDVAGALTSTNITIADGIYHEGDTNTSFTFGTDTINLNTGGGGRINITDSTTKVNNDLIIAGGATFSLGAAGEEDDNGRSVLIEGAANAGNGEGAGRIFFSENNNTSTNSYGLSLYYEGDPNIVLPSGFQPNTGNGTWSLRRHNNSVNGAAIMSGLRTSNNVTFSGTVTVAGRMYVSTVDANATSTTALVLGASNEIEKRTLGSNAFNSIAYLEDISPATPSVDSATVVGETIEITFSESSTPGVDYYQVWSAVGSSTGSYGMIAHVPQEDVASSMTVIDATFSVSDTMYYRVYAVKSGIYSTAGTANRAFSAAALDVANMSVVNLNTAYYIQYEMPDSRFVDHVEIYMDAEATASNLTRTGATLVYSGNNTSYMYKIGANDLDKYHQFWVEVIES